MNMDSSTQLLPQGLDTTDSPTFAGLTLTGLTQNRILYAGAGGVISDTARLMLSGNNLIIDSINQLQFGDSGTYINQGTDGHLNCTADESFDVNSPLSYFSGKVGMGIVPSRDVLEVRASAAGSGISFSQSGVNHGITTFWDTDIFGLLKYVASGQGGLDFTGISDTSTTSGLKFTGIIGVADPSDTTPAVRFSSWKSNGATSIAVLDNSETVAQYLNGTTPLMTILGSGNVGFSGLVNPLSSLHFPDDKLIGFGTTLDATLGYETGTGIVLNLTSVANTDFSIVSTGGTFSINGSTGDLLQSVDNKFHFRDSGIGLYSQADSYLDVFADGGVRIGDSSGGAPTNYSEFEPGGTLVFKGDATVWDDYVTPLGPNNWNGVANNPTLTKLADDGSGSQGVYGYIWSDGDEAIVKIQLPHRWKEGTTIQPHIHFQTTSDVSPADNFGIEFEYWWADIGEDFPANTTLETNDISTGVNTDTMHQIANVSASGIDGSGHTVSSMLICRIKRVAASVDNYAGGIAIHDFDVHYEIDTVGSRQIMTK